MEMQNLTGKHLKITKSTISVLNESGKTAGMITGIVTFYNIPDRERFDFSQKAHKLGINRLRMNWVRMFFVESVWYYLVDESAVTKAVEWQAIDGGKSIKNMEDWQLAAEEYGAVIIHVAKIQDSRGIKVML